MDEGNFICMTNKLRTSLLILVSFAYFILASLEKTTKLK